MPVATSPSVTPDNIPSALPAIPRKIVVKTVSATSVHNVSRANKKLRTFATGDVSLSRIAPDPTTVAAGKLARIAAGASTATGARATGVATALQCTQCSALLSSG